MFTATQVACNWPTGSGPRGWRGVDTHLKFIAAKVTADSFGIHPSNIFACSHKFPIKRQMNMNRSVRFYRCRFKPRSKARLLFRRPLLTLFALNLFTLPLPDVLLDRWFRAADRLYILIKVDRPVERAENAIAFQLFSSFSPPFLLPNPRKGRLAYRW